MTRPSRTRRALGVATPALLAAGALVAPAQATVPAERALLQARVDAVRQALKTAAADAGATPSWTVAQATNWTNWPKWSKWSNWANK
jgi:hypothetical protein